MHNILWYLVYNFEKNNCLHLILVTEFPILRRGMYQVITKFKKKMKQILQQ